MNNCRGQGVVGFECEVVIELFSEGAEGMSASAKYLPPDHK